MLQALQLDSAPAPAKPRQGTGTDPSEGAFAGLMAQASLASATPAVQAPGSPDRTGKPPEPELRETQAPAGTQKAGEPEEAAPGQAKAADSGQPAAPLTKTAPQEAEAASPPAMPLPGPPPQAGSEASREFQASSGAQPGPAAPDPGLQAPPPGKGTPEKPAAASLPEETPQPGPPVQAPPAPAKAAPALAGPVQLPDKTTHPRGFSQIAAAATHETEPEVPAAEAKDPAISLPMPKGTAPAETPAPPKVELPAQHAQRPLEPAMAQEAAAVQAPGRSGQTPAAEAPTGVARFHPVTAQVDGSIRWILQNRAQGAELQLHPESLGRVVIQLRVEGQEVHARLWVSESASLAVLQDHKASLQASLREQGLNLGSFDLHSGTRGDGAQTMPQERPPVGSFLPSPVGEVQQEMPGGAEAPALQAHRIEVFA